MKFKLGLITTVIFVISLILTGMLYSQELPCNSCAGSGAQVCIRCGGNSSYACFNCNGAGGKWEVCNCNGGVVDMPDGTQQVCNYCLGEGRKWHSCYNPLCSNGIVFCNFCAGQGQKICPSCNGSGKR